MFRDYTIRKIFIDSLFMQRNSLELMTRSNTISNTNPILLITANFTNLPYP